MANPATHHRAPVEVLVEYGFAPGTDAIHFGPFVRACNRGLDEVVAAYLDLGMSPNTRSEDGPALHAAAEHGHASTVALLLDRGAAIDVRDGSDDTPLRTALNWGHLEVARILAARGADIEVVNASGETALEHAIAGENDEQRDLLLELGADPNGRFAMRSAVERDAATVATLLAAGGSASQVLDDSGITPLHAAVRKQDAELVDLLLAAGVHPAPRDVHGLTPLDYALMVDDDELVEKLGADEGPTSEQRSRARLWSLIERGELQEALDFIEQHDIGVDARNETHETPLMAFARAGHLAGAQHLLARGARPDARNQTGTAITRAVAAGHDDVLDLLLAAGASPVDPNETPAGIHDAIRSGHRKVVRRLLDACSPAQRTHVAPYLRAAVSNHDPRMIRLLAAKQVPLEHHDEHGLTPLMEAVADEHNFRVARALLDGGADVNAVTPFGETPLHKLLAAHDWHKRHVPTLRLLLERGARLDAVNHSGNTPWGSARDEAKEVLVHELVTGPLEQGMPLAELALRHSWATLAVVAVADERDLLLALVDAGVTLNPPEGTHSETALHAAIDKQDVALVRGLLARGAAVHHAAPHESPLMAAARSESAEILTMLLDAGASPTWTSAAGRHALHWAVDQPQHIELLVARGARLDDQVDTPLLTAARESSVEATKHLLAHGARVDVRDERGRTPLCCAIGSGAHELARLLIEAGASPTFMDRSTGETPLTSAVKHRAIATIELLLARGGSLDDRNQAGEQVRELLQNQEELRQAFAGRLESRGTIV